MRPLVRPGPGLPEGRSFVPTDAEWRAAGEVLVKGSSAAGCKTQIAREWLRVQCRRQKTEDSLDALEHIFKYDIEPARVAAIIIEPVMGEGGFYVAPPEFLQALRKLCDLHGIVLVVDEIQSGFARTGRMFACEHAGIAPDLLCLSKGLTGGVLPLAATLATAATTPPQVKIAPSDSMTDRKLA